MKASLTYLVFIESTINKQDCPDILKQYVDPSIEELELSQNWMFQ